MNFKMVNNAVGWIVLVIASITYIGTAESSTSLWDCGEFISAAYKLQVVHPPGAPLFLMMGRVFALFATSPEQIPVMLNYFSAISTAFAVLFLFWIITALAKKLITKEGEEPGFAQTVAIIGAGLVGALAATFSDTMWFSAVEGEVYALSTFFIAIVLWAVMKWEAHAWDEAGDHWLLFIAFMIGLSIGVHLLSLLVIPITVMVYYFKKYKPTLWGTLAAFAVGFIVLQIVQVGIIQTMTARAANNELMFVNEMGLPFNSGILVYYLLVFGFIASAIWLSRHSTIRLWHLMLPLVLLCLLLASTLAIGLIAAAVGIVLYFLLRYAFNIRHDLQALLMAFTAIIPGYLIWTFIEKNRTTIKGSLNGARLNGRIRQNFELIGLSFLFIMIGFSSYVMIPIRSQANTPINMNAPKDAFSLLSYLNREQYGDRPLIYGPLHDARPTGRKVVGNRYYKDVENKEYIKKGEKIELEYDDSDKVPFPRMYSPDGQHVRMYKLWVRDDYRKPTFAHNIAYFFRYQLGYMYWRYFMWNFAGRQDDFQGTVDNKAYNGNWMSGIPFVDNFRLGSQEGLPEAMREHKARNFYFMLPLIFGLLGLVFLTQKNPRWAFVFILLFILTGVMLIVYFNSPPREPRERDYTLVGSFYTFCVFIGIGVLFLYDLMKQTIPDKVSAVAASAIGILAVPLIMGMQGYDDHNRKHRKMARDFATNFLESCPPNAILFTQGDNDTYPLWYAQEVENIRPDVRVANLSLIGVDWYIEFLQRAANGNGPVPFYEEWTVDKYMGDIRNQVFYQAKLDDSKHYDLQSVMSFVLDERDDRKVAISSGMKANYFPTNKVKLKVDRDAVIANGIVPEEYQDRIVDEITWKLPIGGKGQNPYIIKNDLAILAIIAAADWSRPICFANTVAPSNYNGLGKYLIQEGMMYRFVPVEFTGNRPGTSVMALNDEAMYPRLMENFRYGNLETREHFIDENTHRMMHGLRNVHIALARELTRDGETEKAIAVLERVKEKFPDMNAKYFSPYNNYYNPFTIEWIELYYKNGRKDLAQPILDRTLEQMEDCWRFYNLNTSFADNFKGSPENPLHREYAASNIYRLRNIATSNADDELYGRLADLFPEIVTPRDAVLPEQQFD
jgi:hypothetical protein